MNDFDDQLAASVAATSSLGAADVADRVAARRRQRRMLGAFAATAMLAVGLGAVLVVMGDDGKPDVESIDDPTTTTTTADPDGSRTLAPIEEDPVGSDGATGEMSDLHVETTETFGFIACGADGEPGPPEGARSAELEALIETLRSAGFHDQPFAGGSGGPQSIWGVPSLGLTAWYEPTLRWIADRADPADVCIEFPEFGGRNLPPELAPVEIAPVDGGFTVVAEGCQPKGEWVQPFVRRGTELVELGIALGRGQSDFTDDCPAPTIYEFDSPGSQIGTIATEPGTLAFEGSALVGLAMRFTFDLDNAASSATVGDDLIAQHVDDPTVQFQVSDIFSGAPVAGAVGDVALDQWPITGEGTIVIPEGVTAGTYHVHLIDSPELNGTLDVAVGRSGPAIVDSDVGDDQSEPDGGAGSISDVHIEADELVFPDCASLPQTGASDEDRYEGLRARLVADGVNEQPFINSVGSFGGFVDAVDVILQRRYQPTIDWLGERAGPDELCLLLVPPVGFFNQPPSLHGWELVEEPEPSDRAVTVDRAPGECVSSGERYPPVIHYFVDRIEIALPVRQVAGGVTVLVCIQGGQQVVDLSEAVGDRVVVPASSSASVRLSPDMAAVPLDLAFTVALDLAGLGEESVMGDDVMIQSVDDPSIQIQVGGVFTDDPEAGSPRPIVQDRWVPPPVTVSGAPGIEEGWARLIVPSGTPAGEYTYVFIEHPQLNGTLTVTDVPSGLAGGPDSGWVLPDLNDDGVVDIAAIPDGDVFISDGDAYRRLLDADGTPVAVVTADGGSFVCNNDWGVVLQYTDGDGDGLVSPGGYIDLVVIDGVGALVPSVADVVGDVPLPEPGEGCVAFASG